MARHSAEGGPGVTSGMSEALYPVAVRKPVVGLGEMFFASSSHYLVQRCLCFRKSEFQMTSAQLSSVKNCLGNVITLLNQFV